VCCQHVRAQTTLSLTYISVPHLVVQYPLQASSIPCCCFHGLQHPAACTCVTVREPLNSRYPYLSARSSRAHKHRHIHTLAHTHTGTPFTGYCASRSRECVCNMMVAYEGELLAPLSPPSPLSSTRLSLSISATRCRKDDASASPASTADCTARRACAAYVCLCACGV
jgi:hypothetical protein